MTMRRGSLEGCARTPLGRRNVFGGTLLLPGLWRTVIPGEFLGAHFAGWVSANEGFNAPARTRIPSIREGAHGDLETLASLFDGCFGEARDLEEATRNGGVADCVEGGRRFGFIGCDGGVGVKGCSGGADFDFNFMEGTLGFYNAVPAEGRTRFGKRCNLARRLAPVGARFHGGQSVAVKNEAQDDIKDHRGERDGRAHFASWAF